MIEIYKIFSIFNNRILKQDMPRKNLFPFLSPKYPKYVTRITIKSATGLEKQDRFGCMKIFNS